LNTTDLEVNVKETKYMDMKPKSAAKL